MTREPGKQTAYQRAKTAAVRLLPVLWPERTATRECVTTAPQMSRWRLQRSTSKHSAAKSAGSPCQACRLFACLASKSSLLASARSLALRLLGGCDFFLTPGSKLVDGFEGDFDFFLSKVGIWVFGVDVLDL